MRCNFIKTCNSAIENKRPKCLKILMKKWPFRLFYIQKTFCYFQFSKLKKYLNRNEKVN